MFKLIPTWVYLAAYGLLLAALGLQTLHVYQLKGHIATTELKASRAVSEALQSKIEADEQTRIANEANDKLRKIEEDRLAADGLAASAERLSNSPELTTVIVQARKACPTSPSPSKRTDDPIGVLANVLSGSDRMAEVYAKTADERRVAGSDCERRYDALPE